MDLGFEAIGLQKEGFVPLFLSHFCPDWSSMNVMGPLSTSQIVNFKMIGEDLVINEVK
jgi:hypothetical protein